MLALLILLTGCEPSELYPVPALPIGGGSSVNNTAPAQRPIAPAKQMPMIDNPDEPYQEWEVDQVWGDSKTEAERRCRQIAEDQQVKFVRIERVAPNSKRWRCIISNK